MAVIVPIEAARRFYPADEPSFAALLMSAPGTLETEPDPAPLRDVDP